VRGDSVRGNPHLQINSRRPGISGQGNSQGARHRLQKVRRLDSNLSEEKVPICWPGGQIPHNQFRLRDQIMHDRVKGKERLHKGGESGGRTSSLWKSSLKSSRNLLGGRGGETPACVARLVRTKGGRAEIRGPKEGGFTPQEMNAVGGRGRQNNKNHSSPWMGRKAKDKSGKQKEGEGITRGTCDRGCKKIRQDSSKGLKKKRTP